MLKRMLNKLKRLLAGALLAALDRITLELVEYLEATAPVKSAGKLGGCSYV